MSDGIDIVVCIDELGNWGAGHDEGAEDRVTRMVTVHARVPRPVVERGPVTVQGR